ncbi:hypothetical protein CHS0354_037374 [Potamilus streckersoni]|uniref:Uncharacterized protein n=1 Tax=Potamilus streckersoni TaxID=2493646 RepID=A0AAE0VWW9_9BIVA|nr:hypothetical protein CHS0354_037374 [Potamilus streckersoni]
MEIISAIVFLIGVAFVSGQCSEYKIEQCLNQTNGLFGGITNNNGIQDISKLCSESTTTAFACIKNEMNKCSASLSFTGKEELSLVNRITVEGLHKVCNIFAKMEQGSVECFNRAIQNSMSSIQACMKSDAAFASAELNTATIFCRTFDLTYKCGLERVREACPTHDDDFRSWHDAMHTLFACEDSGNSSSRRNTTPTLLLILLDVLVLITVGS